MKALIRVWMVVFLCLALVPGVAYSGDITESDDDGNRGNPGCPDGTCPDGKGGCVPSEEPCCDDSLASPTTPGEGNGPTCPATKEGNPIDMRNGNKFHEEVLFEGGGELPLRFALYYNSKDFRMVAGVRKVAGNWTYSYSTHLVLPANLGQANSGAIVEVRHEDGRSYFFVEPAAPGAKYFSSDQPGANGFFLALTYANGTYGEFEFERMDGAIERFNAQGQLIEVRSREKVTTTLTYQPQGISTLVTVSRSPTNSMSFVYQESQTNGDNSYCFRCPTTFTAPGGATYGITPNALGLVQTVTFPDDTTESPALPGGVKTFLYIDAGYIAANFPGGCPSLWVCETALTGIVDEEGWRFGTWEYRPRLEEIFGSVEGAHHMGWAYISYHGTAAEKEDHVQFSQATFPPANNEGQSGNDKFVVTRNFAVRDVYNFDHDSNPAEPIPGGRRMKTWFGHG